jgi:hypothetical protein
MFNAAVLLCAVRSRPAVLVAGLLMGGTLATSDSALAQGLFEALFGSSSSARIVYVLPPGVIPEELRSPRPRVTRKKKEARPEPIKVAPRDFSAKPEPYIAPEVLPGPLGRFLRDTTLRKGDVVATSEGLMVFQGAAGKKHRERDLVPVAKSRSLLASRLRSELVKLDRAVGGQEETAHSVFVAEIAPPIVAQDEGGRRR